MSAIYTNRPTPPKDEPLPCCNLIEHEDGSATLCTGTMHYPGRGWVFVCDTCRGQCGKVAHLTCADRNSRDDGGNDG